MGGDILTPKFALIPEASEVAERSSGPLADANCTVEKGRTRGTILRDRDFYVPAGVSGEGHLAP